MDRGAWRATVHVVTESQTQLKELSSNSSNMLLYLCFILSMKTLSINYVPGIQV